MRILGIDPGALANTGWGVIEDSEQPRLVASGVIKTTMNRRVNETRSTQDRLYEIYSQVCGLLKKYEPEVVVMESAYTRQPGAGTVTLINMVRGVIYLATVTYNVPVVEYQPARIKCIVTGNGKAKKTQVREAVSTRLKLGESIESEHSNDALAAALTYAAET